MLDRKILFGLSLVLLSTTYDLSRLYFNAESAESQSSESTSTPLNDRSEHSFEPAADIPAPKIKKHGVPTIKFLFCSS